VIGRTVRVNSHPMDGGGVTPPGFDGVEVGTAVDVFVALARQPEVMPIGAGVLCNWRSRWLSVMARLSPGATRASAESAVNVVLRAAPAGGRGARREQSERARREFLQEAHRAAARRARHVQPARRDAHGRLLVLMGMVGLVLSDRLRRTWRNLLLARGSRAAEGARGAPRARRLSARASCASWSSRAWSCRPRAASSAWPWSV
jgi:hypothetical protein